jgi:DNA-binding transcriptional MerR regulator
MKVSELARRSGVSVNRLRHYETLGLIHAQRSRSGYRDFAESCLREVNFIARSRAVGVSLKDIGDTLPRYRVGTLTFDEMVELMRARIAEVDRQIAAQRELRKKLLSAIAWFKARKRDAAKREPAKTPQPWNPRRSER